MSKITDQIFHEWSCQRCGTVGAQTRDKRECTKKADQHRKVKHAGDGTGITMIEIWAPGRKT